MPASPYPRAYCRRIRLPDRWLSQQSLVLVWRFHLRAVRAARAEHLGGGGHAPAGRPRQRARRGPPRWSRD
jgi:hypothetical protein